MSSVLRVLPFFLVLALHVGCNSSDSSSVINVDEDNAAMNAAMAKAKQTFGFFVDNWKTMKSDSCAIKVRVPTSDDGIEHIWFEPISVNADQLEGVCSNQPRDIPGLKMGDRRSFSTDDISDWMILDGNDCYGGFTIEVMTKLAPDEAPPFTFIDPQK